MTPLEEEVSQSRHARDLAGQAWETAFAGLVLAAKNTDHDGDTRSHDTLFATIRIAKSKKRKAAATTAPPEPATSPIHAPAEWETTPNPKRFTGHPQIRAQASDLGPAW